MSVELTHEQAETLLGVYALDAVEPDESRALEAHLATCEVCRNELSQHLEIVGFLVGEGEAPPEGLWGRVAQKLEEEPPPLRAMPTPDFGASKRSRVVTTLVAITSAAAVLVAVLGVGMVNQSNKLSDAQKQLADGSLNTIAVEAGSDPSNRHYVLVSADGKYKVDSVITPDGTGFITGGNIPDAGDGHAYQLWAVTGGQAISLGMVGHKADVIAFQLPAGTSALALTKEVSSGVVKSEQQPTVAGAITA